MSARSWLSLALLLSQASCAGEPPPPPATPAPVADLAKFPPLPRSSIAAVVQRRAELGLSDDQVRALEMRDLQREQEDAAVRDEVEQRSNRTRDANAAASTGGPSSAGASAGARGMGSSGNGMGGGGMRGAGMRGAGMRGGGVPRGSGSSPAKGAEREASMQDRLDANDTKAYLDAESLLEEGQREHAREVASDFREKLYERREALRAQPAAAK